MDAFELHSSQEEDEKKQQFQVHVQDLNTAPITEDKKVPHFLNDSIDQPQIKEKQAEEAASKIHTIKRLAQNQEQKHRAKTNYNFI